LRADKRNVCRNDGTKAQSTALAGGLRATHAIPIIYVPLLMITHFVAFYWLVRLR